MPAADEFDNLSMQRKAKVLAVARRIAEQRIVSNKEKFKSVENTDLFEIKCFQDRFLGGFRGGRRFVIAAYEEKKKGPLKPQTITRAEMVLADQDARERAGGLE